ncbi:MAG: 50S ribosomal protein L1 [Candidatus Moranbacteria bacterium]|nr:50S ribosomal protein L1 [Candidatus Moranbacteria bacterium]
MKRGKNYKKALEAYDKLQSYPIEEALDRLSNFPKAKFDETVEVHVRTDINPKKSEQHIRGPVALPHGTGKKVKVVAFTESGQEEVKKAGAEQVGGQELIEKVKADKGLDADIAVASPDMMPKLATIAKILGPRGLMPNPKAQTVGKDVAALVEEFKKGKSSFKNDDSGNVHIPIGKRSFSNEQLKENFESFMEALRQAKPEAVKKSFIKSVYLTATMTPSVQVAV